MSSSERGILANVDRLNQFMDRNHLAAVVARSGQNFTYLSGVTFPGTLQRHQDFPDSDRAVMVLWPRNGEPAIIVNNIAVGVTRRDSWLKKLAVYQGYTESPYVCLARVLKEYGLAREQVGFEKNYISAQDWEIVQKALPEMKMVDCTPMMNQVRWVKTEGEIALLKRAADLLDDAYLEVFPTISPGTTERMVHARLIFSCLQRGAGWAHGILNASTNPIPYTGEGDTAFQTGDVVHTDYVAYLEGYPGHQNRNAIVGKASKEQLSTYAAYVDIYRQVIDHCRPGLTAGEVFQFSIDQFAKRGWKESSLLVGHGVGPWWHQQEPVLAAGNKTVLEEGMVIAVEPHLGYWSVQDMVVVRKDRPQLLSDKFNTDKPFIVA
jgi:Xaa-Pro aminopeptidase